MRKKGEIWRQKYQDLIVSKYEAGMPVAKILQLNELQEVKPSEYVVREILKKNKVKPVWQRDKVKEEFWDSEVVDFIIDQRNRGDSFSLIVRKVNLKYKKARMSRSTVVRIIGENKNRLQRSPSPSGEQLERVSKLVVEKYKEGMLVKAIRKLPEVQRYKLSEHSVRTILKQQGVELTGRKGELKRWPEELQQKVVDLYQEGLTFEEIKQQEGIVENNPTDYAIRTILKRRGFTKRKPSYLQPISELRYRRYRDNKLDGKGISLIHKHLARFEEGRELMIRRMGFKELRLSEIDCLNDQLRAVLEKNANHWEGFFHWGMQYLYDDGLKKELFLLGLEYNRALAYLRRSCRDQNNEKIKRAWERIVLNLETMREFQRAILVEPAARLVVDLPGNEDINPLL
jgi:hypothetical protein